MKALSKFFAGVGRFVLVGFAGLFALLHLIAYFGDMVGSGGGLVINGLVDLGVTLIMAGLVVFILITNQPKLRPIVMPAVFAYYLISWCMNAGNAYAYFESDNGAYIAYGVFAMFIGIAALGIATLFILKAFLKKPFIDLIIFICLLVLVGASLVAMICMLAGYSVANADAKQFNYVPYEWPSYLHLIASYLCLPVVFAGGFFWFLGTAGEKAAE